MQALNYVLFALFAITYVLTSFFAISAWFRLRQQRKDLNEIEKKIEVIMEIVMGARVRENFEQLGKMCDHLSELVKSERFEDAEKLRAAIVKMKEVAERSLDTFKKIYGKSVEIIRTE